MHTGKHAGRHQPHPQPLRTTTLLCYPQVDSIPVVTKLLVEAADTEVLTCAAWVLAFLGSNEDNKSHIKQALSALPRLVQWVRWVEGRPGYAFAVAIAVADGPCWGLARVWHGSPTPSFAPTDPTGRPHPAWPRPRC